MNSLRAARVIALLSFVTGLIALPVAAAGDPWSPTWHTDLVAVGLYLDPVSASLLLFVGLLGWVISTYSMTNLRGRVGLPGAGIALSGTLLALMVMVASADLVTMAAGLTVTLLSVPTLERARLGTLESSTDLL